jgi:hypothetical protein
MSETMSDELGSLRWTPTSLPVTPSARDGWHAATPVGSSDLPVMRPGQLWLVELPAAAPEFAPLEHRALRNANVVIYDRALAPTVAHFLPLGGYAEPVASSDGQRGAGAERCVRFARDGWSVARLFSPGFHSGGERSGSCLTACSARCPPVCRSGFSFLRVGVGTKETKHSSAGWMRSSPHMRPCDPRRSRSFST